MSRAALGPMWGTLAGKHRLEAAEPVQEGVGRRVGVHPGDGEEQQQLQQLVVREGLAAAAAVLRLFSIPMSVMNAHSALLPAICLAWPMIIPHKRLFHKWFFHRIVKIPFPPGEGMAWRDLSNITSL